MVRRRFTQLTDLRRQAIRESEDKVLAEATLRGSRAVAIARVGLAVLFGVTQNILVATGRRQRDPVMMAVGIAYLVSALLMALAINRRVRLGIPGSVATARAKVLPNVVAVIDFALVTFMANRDLSLGHPEALWVLGAVLATLIAFSIPRYTLREVLLTLAVALGVFLVTAHHANALGSAATWFITAALVSLSSLIGWANLGIRNMFVNLRRREGLERLLPRQVVDRVLASAGAPLQAVQREVTVLFVDVRGFTTLSETLPPAEVMALLDVVLGELSRVVKGRDGMLNKFLGDGLLAVWNAPELVQDHPIQAVRAALEMHQGLEELNRERAAQGLSALKIGVGVHTGNVAAGMLGGDEQQEYAVIGDAVNLASRIEGLTKQFGAKVLVSDATWDKLGDRFLGERLGATEVKGRAGAVVVYKVDAAKRPEADPLLERSA